MEVVSHFPQHGGDFKFHFWLPWVLKITYHYQEKIRNPCFILYIETYEIDCNKISKDVSRIKV